MLSGEIALKNNHYYTKLAKKPQSNARFPLYLFWWWTYVSILTLANVWTVLVVDNCQHSYTGQCADCFGGGHMSAFLHWPMCGLLWWWTYVSILTLTNVWTVLVVDICQHSYTGQYVHSTSLS